MKMQKSFFLIHTFILAYILVGQSWAIHIIDIEESNFGKNVKHTHYSKPTENKSSAYPLVRLVHFDTDLQKFDAISYYLTPAKSPYIFEYRGIKITYGYEIESNPETFSIKIDASQILEDTWCVSPIKPTAAQVSSFTWTDRSTPTYFMATKSEPKYLKENDLEKFLEKFKNRRNTPKNPFKAQFLIGETDFCSSYNLTGTGAGSIHTLVTNHTEELGNLGELAADLTFFSHGFKKLPSKIKGSSGKGKGNKGIDGIYVNAKEEDPTKRQLWFVEAKFRNDILSGKDFEGYLSPKVSKKGALDQYQTSSDTELKETAALVKGYQTTHEENILLLGYGVMSNGTVRTPFIVHHAKPQEQKEPTSPNSSISHLEALTSQSPASQKEQALASLLSEFQEKAGLSRDECMTIVSRLDFSHTEASN